MTDVLERTLEDLDFELPAGLVNRALEAAAARPSRSRSTRGSWRRSGNILVGVAIASMLLVGANALAAYFAPRYGQVLAGAPILGGVAGPVLHFSGLDASTVVPLNQAATSSGHTVKLIGAYADSERTVLFLEVDGQPHVLPNKQQSCCYADATLTDQFGHSYQEVYSVDALAPAFSPLVAPASNFGARLTLHISSLMPTGPGFTQATGDWELHLTLVQQSGGVLPLPAPVTANEVTYTFTSLRLSQLQLKVNYTISGALVDQQRGAAAQAPDPNSFFFHYAYPKLVNTGGAEAQLSDWGLSWPKQGPAVGDLTAILPGPGIYTLTLGNLPGAATVQIQVP